VFERPIRNEAELVEELHAGRFQAVHRPQHTSAARV
jgi:hypothetical protein